jgi:hypothetical protein
MAPALNFKGLINQQALDRFVLTLRIKFIVPFVFGCGLVLWLVLCDTHYEAYWNGTIRKVQTTDFNILHHTMPTTLSAMILADRPDLVQQALDSSYGLFGMAVTDPSGQNILYKTEKSYHHQSWKDRLNKQGLAKETDFDLITDPPQMAALWAYDSPRTFKAKMINHPVAGRVLGRLYYLRDNPPTFNTDLANFLFSDWTELAGAKRGYCYITFTVLFFAVISLLLVFLRRRGLELKQREVDFIRRELEIRRKALDHLNNELATQKARKVWLEREADQAYKRAIGLKNSLEKLRDALAGAMAQQTATGDNVTALPSPPKEGKPSNSHVRIRPVAAPPSTILEEIEVLIPDLSENANALRSQADILNDYCNALEERQVEMKRIVETAFVRAQKIQSQAPMGQMEGQGPLPGPVPGASGDVLDMRPN